VAVPIIIHLLLRRRKRPMEWGAMRFVLEAYRKTRRRTTLERWLLLACRCLLLAALGVALARPLVSGQDGSGGNGRTVWFVLDDGLIGQTTEEGKSDVARAVARCKGVLGSLGPGDRAGIVLAGSPPRALVTPPSGNLAGVSAALDALSPSDTPSDWPGALGVLTDSIMSDRAVRANATDGSDIVFIAQGARAGTGRIGDPLPRLPSGVRLVLAEPSLRAPSNVSVAGVRALRPVLISGVEGSEAAQTVTVTLRRYGDSVEKQGSSRVSVRLGEQDHAASVAVVPWSAGQREASATLVVDSAHTAGAGGAAVVLAWIDGDGDAVAGDNTRRLPVLSRESLRVGLLADAAARGSSVSGGTADRFRPGQWVTFALRPSESATVDIVEIEPGAIDAARIAGLDAIVVLSPDAIPVGNGASSGWSRLKGFVDRGGLLVITPAFEATSQQWPEAMASELGVDLSLGRAPKEYPAESPGRLSGAAPVELGTADILATLRGELDVLVRPVGVSRILAPLETSGLGTEGRADTKVLVRTVDGDPFITLATRAAGAAERTGAVSGAVIYVSSAFDLRWTDLPAKPLMVPLLQELIRQGIGRARPVHVSVAGSKAAAPAGATTLRSAAAGAPTATLSVDTTGRTTEPVRLAGAWQAVDGQGGTLGVVAVNPPTDADTTPLSRERLASWLTPALPEKGASERAPEIEWAGSDIGARGLSAVVQIGAENRVGSGSLLLIAVLALALCEVVLARAASASSVRSGGKGVADA